MVEKVYTYQGTGRHSREATYPPWYTGGIVGRHIYHPEVHLRSITGIYTTLRYTLRYTLSYTPS